MPPPLHRLAALLLLPLAHAQVMVVCPANQTFDASLQACCTQCAVGSGVALPCQATNDTVCEPCRPGKEWSSVDSHSAVCELCHACPPHAHVTQACSSRYNTQCACDTGYFGRAVTDDRFACYECSRCAAGEYTLRPCDHLHDTVCAPCANGTHSPHAGAVACRACSQCPAGSATLKPCSPEMDTICEGSPFLPVASDDGQRSVPPHDRPPANATNGPQQHNLIPLYCTLLGAVFVGLVVYVAVKKLSGRCCQNNPKKRKQKQAVDQETGSYSHVPQSASCHNQLLGIPCEQVYMKTAHRPASMWQTSPSKLSFNSANSTSTKTPLPTGDSQQQLLGHPSSGKVSAACVQQLAALMHNSRTPDGRHELCAAVARRLGYADELDGLRERTLYAGESCSLTLLRRWNEDGRTTAGVTALLKVLQHYRRQDMVDLLCAASACVYNV